MIDLAAMIRVLNEKRGDIKMDNEDLAILVCETVGVSYRDQERAPVSVTGGAEHSVMGDTPVLVAREFRRLRMWAPMSELFTDAQLHEMWAEFLDAQTIDKGR